MTQTEIQDQTATTGGIDTFIRHLKSPTGDIIRLVSVVLSLLCSVKKYANEAANQGVIPALVAVLKLSHEPEVLVEVVNAIGVMCDGDIARQTLLHNTNEGLPNMCSLLDDAVDSDLILALTRALGRVSRKHEVNQNAIVDCKAMPVIIALTNLKNRDIQLSAVDTIHHLVEGNSYTQRVTMREGAINPLMTLLKRSKTQVIQEKTAGALWGLAGDDGEERRAMAARMEVNLLIDFLGSLSEILHFIGSEGSYNLRLPSGIAG